MPTTRNEVVDRIDFILDDLEANVVKISARRELILAVGLVYHSPRAFHFQGKKIEKGAGELLVVGDSRTGKTSTIKALMRHFGAGDFLQGEAVSMAGLLAGVDESNRRRFVRAGRLPLSHRRLVTIDEANEIDREIIGKLSGVRSSGVLDIVKINSRKMPCLVRSIWIANTRGPRSLSEYAYGVEAIPGLIGKPEDVARFDLAIGYAEGDVDEEALYLPSREWKVLEHRYTSEMCRTLIRWVWSRGADDFVIDEEAEDVILAEVRELCKEFDPAIPLFIPAEGRIKLAKIACAVAAWTFSTDRLFQSVIVKREHVEAAALFIRRIFNVPSLAYGTWSDQRRRGTLDKSIERVIDALGRKGSQTLINSDSIAKMDLVTIFGGEKEAAEIAYGHLVLEGALVRRGGKMTLSAQIMERLKSVASSVNGGYFENPRPDVLVQYSRMRNAPDPPDDDLEL